MGGKSAKRAMYQVEEETFGHRLRLSKYMHVCECVRGGWVATGGEGVGESD